MLTQTPILILTLTFTQTPTLVAQNSNPPTTQESRMEREREELASKKKTLLEQQKAMEVCTHCEDSLRYSSSSLFILNSHHQRFHPIAVLLALLSVYNISLPPIYLCVVQDERKEIAELQQALSKLL